MKSQQGECISGPLAQLVERLHGMQEVSGSNPLGSTKLPGGKFALRSSAPLSEERARMASHIANKLEGTNSHQKKCEECPS